MLREFCAENLAGVREAIEAGAQRVELCDDLSAGGITPSDAVIKDAVKAIHALGAAVMVMVRPRGGGFAYGEEELACMVRTIVLARTLGADGVVFGCVRDGKLDLPSTRRLVDAANGLDMTFHMAFDEIDPRLQLESLGLLVDLGFSRVLTHGGSLSLPIEECLPRLRTFVDAARGRISIMPGGGVTWENAESVALALGVHEVHGTRIVRMPV